MFNLVCSFINLRVRLIIIMSGRLQGLARLSLAICHYHPSLQIGFQVYILCPYRAVVDRLNYSVKTNLITNFTRNWLDILNFLFSNIKDCYMNAFQRDFLSFFFVFLWFDKVWNILFLFKWEVGWHHKEMIRIPLKRLWNYDIKYIHYSTYRVRLVFEDTYILD